jgi:hypothetical protein
LRDGDPISEKIDNQEKQGEGQKGVNGIDQLHFYPDFVQYLQR